MPPNAAHVNCIANPTARPPRHPEAYQRLPNIVNDLRAGIRVFTRYPSEWCCFHRCICWCAANRVHRLAAN